MNCDFGKKCYLKHRKFGQKVICQIMILSIIIAPPQTHSSAITLPSHSVPIFGFPGQKFAYIHTSSMWKIW